MSQDIPGLVETSTNLATINIVDERVRIGTSQGSSTESAKEYIANSVAAVFKLANARVAAGDGYPGWKPNMDSELLKVSKKVFNELFKKAPEIKTACSGV